ncbi:MAG: hypothetical protein L0H36_00725 [bacterium]|nr:hypothetical protein [bacterium]
MNKLLFATGNSRKIQEARQTLDVFGIELEPVSVDSDEIQHSDPAEITKAKARAAYSQLGKPVVVSDTSWSIPALGGFPGGYMKDIGAWLQAEDWLALMSRHADKTIYCHEHVAYYDGQVVRHFVSTYDGLFVDSPRGRVDDDESFEQVVSLYGGQTMAEQLADGAIASAGESLDHWKQFCKWYATKD